MAEELATLALAQQIVRQYNSMVPAGPPCTTADLGRATDAQLEKISEGIHLSDDQKQAYREVARVWGDLLLHRHRADSTERKGSMAELRAAAERLKDTVRTRNQGGEPGQQSALE